jgi:BTB/POZ domain-containing protein KCTD9
MESRAPRPPATPSRLDRFRNQLEVMAADRPHHLTFYIFLAACAIVIPISLPFWIYETGEFFKEVMAEAHGVLMDILIIGWLLFWLRKKGERRLITNRYREEIEDFLGWRSAEATLRIAGNIRRLNRLNIRIPLKLTEAYLAGAKLAEADLEEADLWGADLSAASLPNARLAGANLAGANLRGTDLERANLTSADLRGADLTEADLERAFLERADLRAANLTASDLQFASLPGANLEHARLLGANLRGAHLERTNLRRASFEGANLHGASLDGADLREADLTRADLTRADLTGTLLPTGETLITLFDDVRSLEGVRLPPPAERTLRQACPHLFAPVEA